jgi:two-component system response regulator HydG/two-component system response regulator AtoC
MIGMNCAAIPDALLESELFGYERGAFTGASGSLPGKLRLADGGSVFLDEVGDMNIYAQAKILRVLDTRSVHPLGSSRAYPIDIRIIAATNQDLEALLRQGRFRADLYYRLNVARIHLPPLRERKADLALLLDHYLGILNGVFKRYVIGLTEEALLAVLNYDWPGNIREFRNALEWAYLNGSSETLSLNELPPQFRAIAGKTPHASVDDEPRMLAALAETNWNKTEAARKLQWSRMTLYRKMAKYEIGRHAKAQSA